MHFKLNSNIYFCNHVSGTSDTIIHVFFLLQMTQDNIYSLISALDFFCISKLRPLCAYFLWHFVNVRNCLHIMPVAEFYGYIGIARSAFRFACKSFYQVMAHEDFLEIPHETLMKFLTSSVLNVPDETDLLIVSNIYYESLQNI